MASAFSSSNRRLDSTDDLYRRLEMERKRRMELESYLRRLCTPQRWAKHWAETTEPWREIIKLLEQSHNDTN